jgi:tetratricopeptide (TPR) repeat protein
MLRGVRRSLVLLAAGTAYAGGTAAAAQHAPGAIVQPLPGNDGGAELRRHLADLAANPRSVASLVGAGRAAIRVGDGEAALGFFARAEEIVPNDARVKAGMASAFVLLGRGDAALRFFAESSRYGAPESEIARDRGLAYDLTGNPRRAQQDYAMVLQRGEDAETRRRMALSLAISGHREAGLRALDPLLRNHDRAAYRTRAFVLALTGDAAGASQAVDAAMPGQGSAMAPFLSRLAGLNPAQKAMAVHFGHFPADGRPVQMAQAVDTTPYPAAVALTGAAPTATAPGRFAQQVARPQQRTAAAQQPQQQQPRRRVALAQPVTRRDDELDRSERIGPGSRSEGRRPLAPVRANAQAAREQQPAAAARSVPAASSPAPAQTQPIRIASAPPLEIPPAMRQDPPPAASQQTVPAVRQDPPAPVRQQPVPAPRQAPPAAAEALPQETPVVLQEAPPTVVRQDVPASAASEPPAEPAPPPATSPAVADFSDVAALVQSLPTEEDPPARRAPPTSRPATAPARSTPAQATPSQSRTATPAAGRSAAASRTTARTPAPPPHPSRHWVQIANGERSAFAFQLGRLRQSAPELLRNRQAWWAKNGNSERLLVGPFATEAEARAFVTQLSRKDVASFPWTSDAGEEVERLPAR